MAKKDQFLLRWRGLKGNHCQCAPSQTDVRTEALALFAQPK